MAKVTISISFDPEVLDLVREKSPYNLSGCVNDIVKCCLSPDPPRCSAETCLGKRGGCIPDQVRKVHPR